MDTYEGLTKRLLTHLHNHQYDIDSEHHRGSLLKHQQHQILAPSIIIRLLDLAELPVSLLDEVRPGGVVGGAARDGHVRREVVGELRASVVFRTVDPAAVELMAKNSSVESTVKNLDRSEVVSENGIVCS